jgi:hypothetical protein
VELIRYFELEIAKNKYSKFKVVDLEFQIPLSNSLSRTLSYPRMTMLPGHNAQTINEIILPMARFSVYYGFNTW